MSIKLTKKQTLIIEFINDFITVNGFAPTYREIMTGLGLSSVSTVAEHVNNLITKGVLRKLSDEPRALEVIDLTYPETTALFTEKLKYTNESDTEVLLQAANILGLDLDVTTET